MRPITLPGLAALMHRELRDPPDARTLRSLAEALRALRVDGFVPSLLAATPSERAWAKVDVVDAPHGRASLVLLPARGATPLATYPGSAVLLRTLIGRVRVETWGPAPPAEGRAALARATTLEQLDDASPLSCAHAVEGLRRVESLGGPAALIELVTPQPVTRG